MPFHPFIAFEGPIASGKTTHADLLARKLGVRPIPEEFPENEFLADFYGDQTRWALPMQLSFLVLRTAQLRKIVHPLIEPVLVDYSYLKDPAFAQLLLK
ncbi:MAG: deoxynucleoside kinase, partial [Candidatus Sulfotelmatobacter sp.]